MSGGHWDYSGFRIMDALETIAEDERAKELWPKTTAILGRLGRVIYDVEHEMDWALSGDTNPDDVSDEDMVARIRGALNEVT